MKQFEYWSQLCLRQYFPDLVQHHSSYYITRKSPLRPPHLLCVIGMIGSGKSEATRLLKDQFGYTEINTGRLVAKLLGIPPVPQTPRESFQEKAWNFIQSKTGPSRLAKAIHQEAIATNSPCILVDGIRQKRTLEALRTITHPSKVGVLYVHTPADLAYDFYKKRENKDIDVLSFFRLREAPVEQEVPGLIAESDAVLYNWTGREKYRQTITSLMGDLQK